jgi:Family of unknown function (DUF5681)
MWLGVVDRGQSSAHLRRCTQPSHEVGLIGPMSKADAADSDSTVRKHRQRGLIPWKPGQSGNPKGRPRGSRNKLSEEFFRDLCDVWQAFGKPALETMAMLYPVEFVRMVASLMPREPEATITPVTVMERMSDAQLDALIAQCIEGGLDPAATD